MNEISPLIPELLGRTLRYSSPEIITLDGVPIEPRSLIPPGTVTFLVAKRGCQLLKQIRSAAYRKDYDALRRHGNANARDLARISRPRERLRESPQDIPVLTEFRYGGRILAQGMFTSATEVATASVLYSGGPLRAAEFQAVNYFHPLTMPDTEHVVIVSMPSLTELEHAILSHIPADHPEAFVSGIFWPAAAAHVGAAHSPNVVVEAAAVEEEEDDRARTAQEEAERTVEGEALKEIGRPEAGDVGARDEIGDLSHLNPAYAAALQQQDFSMLDETASAQTLLQARVQLRKRR